jgi:hypothetical protein
LLLRSIGPIGTLVGMTEDIESEVTWAQGKVALDLHIGSPVRVVVTGMFGFVHSEGTLRPSTEPFPCDDHAYYVLDTVPYGPLPFTLTRNESASCTVTDSALMIDYGQAMIRIVWSDVQHGQEARARTAH